jgi:hypothetical protein
MRTYFFDLVDTEVARDRIGQVFADEDDAIAHAMLHTRDIAAERARSGCLNRDSYVDLRTDAGECITRITFADALDIDCPHETVLALLPLLAFLPVVVAAGVGLT